MTATLLIDNLAFAKKHEHIEGELSAAECTRLSELILSFDAEARPLAADAVRIHYRLQGSVDAMAQHYLNLKISAECSVICQRCLAKMPVGLALEYNYLLAAFDEADAELNDSDDIDLQEPSQAMDVVALIEDEVLMAMPIAPTHSEACGAGLMQSGEKPNPFSVLKGLIKP